MPSESFDPDSPRDWLLHAESDLIMARDPRPGVFYESLCFHAQQAAEKAIKAVIKQQGVDFPYVHNIVKLIAILREVGIEDRMSKRYFSWCIVVLACVILFVAPKFAGLFQDLA